MSQIVGVALLWGLTWLVLWLFRRFLHRGKHGAAPDKGRKHSLFLIVQYLIWTISIAAMMEIIGLHVSVLLAGSAALLVGLGLGVQQIFRDIMSGIFLLFEGTIEVGDVLQVDGTVSRVAEINLRTSSLETRDGLIIIVPNYKFITETVINWSHRDESPARFAVNIGVNYKSDEQKVRSVMLDCALAHPDVLDAADQPQPQVRLLDFADEKMVFELTFWTQRKFEVDIVRSDLRFAIRQAFSANEVLMTKG